MKLIIKYIPIIALPLLLSDLSPECRGAVASAGCKYKLDSTSQLITHQLPNGLTYFIQRNSTPKNIIELLFVVKTGFNHENSDQHQVAHLIEHCALRGSKTFPNGYRYELERQGLKAGYHFNASTNGNYTTYEIKIPADRPELSRMCVKIFSDISNKLTLSEHIISSEKAIITQELGLTTNTSSTFSTQRETGNAISKHLESVYTKAEELQIIKGLQRKDIVSFYKNWYRPDLAAVIIVGDINPKSVENLIITTFSKLTKPKSKVPPIKDITEPIKVNSMQGVYKDNNENTSTVQIAWKSQTPADSSTQEQHAILSELFNIAINTKFSRLHDSTFFDISNLNASFSQGYRNFALRLDVLNIGFSTASQEYKNAFLRFYQQVELVRRFGFTQREFLSAKKKLRRNMFPTSTINSSSIIREYASQFIKGYIPTNFFDIKSRRSIFIDSELSIQILNTTIASNFFSDDIVIFAAGQNIKVDSLTTWINKIQREPMKNLTSKNDQKDLKIPITPNLSKGEIQIHEYPEYNVTELLLRNGIKVVMRPTNNSENPGYIYIDGFQKDGFRTIDFDSIPEYRYAYELANHSGIGNLSRVELQRYFEDNEIGITPYIEDNTHGLRGHGPLSNLETLIQSIYANCIDPNFNTGDYTKFRSSYANSKSLPFSLSSKIDSLMKDRTFNFRQVSERFTLTDAKRLYNRFIKIDSTFIFVISGDFVPNDIIPLVDQYFSQLPVTSKISHPAKRNDTEVKRNIHKTFTSKSLINHANVEILLVGEGSDLEYPDVRFDVIRNMLQSLLTHSLRSQYGFVYSLNVNTKQVTDNKGTFIVDILFQSETDKVADAIAIVFSNIERLQSTNIDQDTFSNALAQTIEEQQMEESTPFFWMSYLKQQFLSGSGCCNLLARNAFLRKMDINDIGPLFDSIDKQHASIFLATPLP